MNNSLENLSSSVTIPLTSKDYNIALELAKHQVTKNKQEQVYVNVLSSLVVKHYFDILGIKTDFNNSYVSHQFYHLTGDIADLKIIDHNLEKQGHLECRPLMKDDDNIYIPIDVWEERIAYIFVQFDKEYKEGLILGFLPTIHQKKVSINQLQSLEQFLDFLYIKSVDLREWLNHKFSHSWISLEEFLSPSQLQPQITFRLFPVFRSLPITGLNQELQELNKNINLEQPIKDLVDIIKTTENYEKFWQAVELLSIIEPSHPDIGIRRIKPLENYLESPIMLSIHIVKKESEKIAIALQVDSSTADNKLPPQLTLTLFEGTDKLVEEIVTKSRPLDISIMLKFNAMLGEQFTVKLTLGDKVFSEHFIV